VALFYEGEAPRNLVVRHALTTELLRDSALQSVARTAKWPDPARRTPCPISPSRASATPIMATWATHGWVAITRSLSAGQQLKITGDVHVFQAIADTQMTAGTAGEAQGRAAEPWEIAHMVVFLASDLSRYSTGEVISVSTQHP
jgi:hypothetical protein